MNSRKLDVMRIYFFFLLLLPASFTACEFTGQSNEIRELAKQNYTPSIQEIQSYYKGNCVIRFHKSLNSNAQYLEVEMSESTFLNTPSEKSELAFSNIALLLFLKQEKDVKKYDFVRVTVIRPQSTISHDFKIAELKLVKRLMIHPEKIHEVLKSGQINELRNIIYNKNLDFDMFLSNIRTTQDYFGKVTGDFEPLGYYFRNDTLHISGQVLREIQSHSLSVEIDTKFKNGKVVLMDYIL